MENLLSLIVLVSFCFAFYCAWKHTHKPVDQLNFIRTEQELDSLNKQREELRALEYLITDIDACSEVDGLYKYFTLRWMNENTGEVLEYQFFVYDHKSPMAYALKNVADIERQKLRPKFQQSLDMLGSRSRKPVDKVPDIIIRDHRDLQ